MDPLANSMGLLGPTQFPSQPTGGFPRSGFHHPDLPPPGFVDPATQVFNAAPENVTDYWNRIAQFYGHDDAGMGDPNTIGQPAPNMGVADVAGGGIAGMQQGAVNQFGPNDLPFEYLSPDTVAETEWLAPGEAPNAEHGGVWTGQGIVARPEDQEGGRWEARRTTLGAQNPNLAAMWNQGPEFQGATGTDPNEPTMDWVFVRDSGQAAPAPAPAQEPDQAPQTMPQQWDPNRLYEDDDYFLNMSRRSVEGLNRMPFVGPQSMRYGFNTGQSGYADIPYDPLLAMDSFYPNFLQGWQDNMIDPFDGEQLQHQLSGT